MCRFLSGCAEIKDPPCSVCDTILNRFFYSGIFLLLHSYVPTLASKGFSILNVYMGSKSKIIYSFKKIIQSVCFKKNVDKIFFRIKYKKSVPKKSMTKKVVGFVIIFVWQCGGGAHTP